MQYINENDILSSDEYTSIYLSIWDKKEEVSHYFKNLDTDFHVISNADKLAERYGVSITPTFIVIDEEGKVEQAQKGFDRDFLMTLKK